MDEFSDHCALEEELLDIFLPDRAREQHQHHDDHLATAARLCASTASPDFAEVYRFVVGDFLPHVLKEDRDYFFTL